MSIEEEEERDSIHSRDNPPPPSSHMCQDSNEVSVEMNGFIEHQKHSLIDPHYGLCGFNGNQHITHLHKKREYHNPLQQESM